MEHKWALEYLAQYSKIDIDFVKTHLNCVSIEKYMKNCRLTNQFKEDIKVIYNQYSELI